MKSVRKSNGSSVAEMPAVLWVLFVLLTFPLVDLAAVTMRYTFLLTTSREAVMVASRAKTFYADSSVLDPSARNLASATAYYSASRFTGITVTSVQTRIVATDLNTNSISYYDTPLTLPADSATSLYSFETTVTGSIQPLLPFRGPAYTNVPGLTGPMTVAISSQKMCENIQGLNR